MIAYSHIMLYHVISPTWFFCSYLFHHFHPIDLHFLKNYSCTECIHPQLVFGCWYPNCQVSWLGDAVASLQSGPEKNGMGCEWRVVQKTMFFCTPKWFFNVENYCKLWDFGVDCFRIKQYKQFEQGGRICFQDLLMCQFHGITWHRKWSILVRVYRHSQRRWTKVHVHSMYRSRAVTVPPGKLN